MPADALGRPLRLTIATGQVGNITRAPMLLEGQDGGAVLADKAWDSNALRAAIAGMCVEAVIPSNRCRKVAIPHNATATATASDGASASSSSPAASQYAMSYDRRTVHFAGS